jgi:hypothetical protein
MRKFLWLFAYITAPIMAQNYTFTAPHLTMHQGDPVPPCPIVVIDQSSGLSVGEGASLFNGSGYASCTIGATSTSPVGTYTITINRGDLAPKSGGSVTLQDSSIDVIPVDANGAKLTNTYPYPTGFTSGPEFPMINVTSNPICNMVHDNGATDNTACLQNLLTYGGLRSKAGALVSTSGTTVTRVDTVAHDNMDFTTIPMGTNIIINGSSYTVASVTSSTTLILTTSAPTLTDVLLSVPITVNTSGTTVTATNGISFSGMSGTVLIGGTPYTIASVTDPTHLTTTTTLPTLTNAPFYLGNWSTNGTYGRSRIYLYFPGGIYWIKGPVYTYDNYWTMIGDGPQKSTIKLAPNTKQFNTGTALAMINVSNVSPSSNFSEVFENMGLRIGQGNPNAVGILWLNNNVGAMRNVQIWSEDSNAASGVQVGATNTVSNSIQIGASGGSGYYTGPTLLKDLAVYGAQMGINEVADNNEYSVTLDEITVEGQQTTGIAMNMTASTQHLLSDNSVAAINVTAQGRNALLDSELLSQNTSGTGLTFVSGNKLYFKNITCSGYSTCVQSFSPLPAEGWTGTAQTIFDSSKTAGSLPLAATETPLPVDPAVTTWTQLGSDPSTWCTSITNSSSTTVYLPPGTYTANQTVTCTIPDTVNHILMYDAPLSYSTPSTVRVQFTVAGSSATPLVIDGCIHQLCQIDHIGSRTLVLRDSNLGYQTAPGAGNVYFEDVETGGYDPQGGSAQNGPTFYANQFVTARQLDIETGASDGVLYPKIQCQGANIWILGYKTENNSPSIVETAGCQADLYGFYYYNLQATVAGAAPMVLTDSSLFATGFNNWSGAKGSPNWVNETRNGVAQSLANPGYNQSYGDALNMFYSYGATP